MKQYKEILQQEMEYQASLGFSNSPELCRRLITNAEQTEFIVLMQGWSGPHYVHGVLFHFAIQEDKIWLFANHTDVEIGEKLSEKGIPKAVIVPAFASELERMAEGYATA